MTEAGFPANPLLKIDLLKIIVDYINSSIYN